MFVLLSALRYSKISHKIFSLFITLWHHVFMLFFFRQFYVFVFCLSLVEFPLLWVNVWNMSNIEYRKQPHICLCLVLFLVLVVVDNAHSTSKAFSTVHPSDLLFRLVQSGQTVSLGAAASLVLFFLIFLFTAIVSLYTQTVTLYALAYIHTLPTTNYSVRLYTIHAREIPPRPYKPFSFLFSCVLTLTAFLALSLVLVVSYFGCVLSRRALFSLLLYFRLFLFLKLSILLIHVRWKTHVRHQLSFTELCCVWSVQQKTKGFPKEFCLLKFVKNKLIGVIRFNSAWEFHYCDGREVYRTKWRRLLYFLSRSLNFWNGEESLTLWGKSLMKVRSQKKILLTGQRHCSSRWSDDWRSCIRKSRESEREGPCLT